MKIPVDKATQKKMDKVKLARERRKFRESVRKDKAKIKRENKSLPKKADFLWAKVVRQVWACAYCGKAENLNAHHIFSRHNKSVRWDLENWICLCSWCHVFSDKFSAHKTPTDFTYWLEKQYSREWLETLGRKANTPLHVDSEYLQATIIYLKNELWKSQEN